MAVVEREVALAASLEEEVVREADLVLEAHLEGPLSRKEVS